MTFNILLEIQDRASLIDAMHNLHDVADMFINIMKVIDPTIDALETREERAAAILKLYRDIMQKHD